MFLVHLYPSHLPLVIFSFVHYHRGEALGFNYKYYKCTLHTSVMAVLLHIQIVNFVMASLRIPRRWLNIVRLVQISFLDPYSFTRIPCAAAGAGLTSTYTASHVSSVQAKHSSSYPNYEKPAGYPVTLICIGWQHFTDIHRLQRYRREKNSIIGNTIQFFLSIMTYPRNCHILPVSGLRT